MASPGPNTTFGQAATASTSADHSAIVVVGAVGTGVDQKVWVLETWRGQVEVPVLVQHLRRLQQLWYFLVSA